MSQGQRLDFDQQCPKGVLGQDPHTRCLDHTDHESHVMLVHELKALPDRSKLSRFFSAMGVKAHLHNGCETFENVSPFQYPDRRRERPQARHNHEKTILTFY